MQDEDGIDNFKRGPVKATFNMGQHDYDRLNDVLKINTDYFLNIRKNPTLLPDVYAALNEFYRAIRPLLLDAHRAEMDIKRDALKTLLFNEHNRLDGNRQSYSGFAAKLNESVIDEADAFYNLLMDYRQIKGMGTPVSKETSEGQKIKRAVRGSG